jgi:hypothetical protein
VLPATFEESEPAAFLFATEVTSPQLSGALASKLHNTEELKTMGFFIAFRPFFALQTLMSVIAEVVK